jgi:hypothetical protein
MKTAAERLRIGALVRASLVGLILGLMLGQRSTGDHGGSRIDWPTPESLGLHPHKS